MSCYGVCVCVCMLCCVRVRMCVCVCALGVCVCVRVLELTVTQLHHGFVQACAHLQEGVCATFREKTTVVHLEIRKTSDLRASEQ